MPVTDSQLFSFGGLRGIASVLALAMMVGPALSQFAFPPAHGGFHGYGPPHHGPPHHGPPHHGSRRHIYHSQDHNRYGSYNFGYDVADPYSGERQTRRETSHGPGHVDGEYTVVESDGSLRVVKYSADGGGFRANVNGQPHGYH